MAKPATKPRFATGGGAALTEPSEAKKDLGWTAEKPPHQYMNWLHKWTSAWIDYLDNLTAEAITWTAAHVFSGAVQMNAGLNASGVGVSGHVSIGGLTTAAGLLTANGGISVTGGATIDGTVAGTLFSGKGAAYAAGLIAWHFYFDEATNNISDVSFENEYGFSGVVAIGAGGTSITLRCTFDTPFTNANEYTVFAIDKSAGAMALRVVTKATTHVDIVVPGGWYSDDSGSLSVVIFKLV